MAASEETRYACSHQRVHQNSSKGEGESDWMKLIHTDNSPCPTCLLTYTNQGPVILEDERPALVIGLKGGVMHPENEYIFQIERVRESHISFSLVVGRKAREPSTFILQDVEAHELLPYAKATFDLWKEKKKHPAPNIRLLARALYAVAILKTDLRTSNAADRYERALLTHITWGNGNTHEKTLSAAAEEVCSRCPPQIFKTTGWTDETQRAVSEQAFMAEAQEVVDTGATFVAFARAAEKECMEQDLSRRAEDVELLLPLRSGGGLRSGEDKDEDYTMSSSPSTTLSKQSLRRREAWYMKLRDSS